MTRGTEFYPLKPLVPRTFAPGGGVLQGVPTPTAQEAGVINPENVEGELRKNSRIYVNGKHTQVTLNRYVNLWPTPTRRDYRSEKCSQATKDKRNESSRGKTPAWEVEASDGGQLSPMWTELLMAWPYNSTKLED
jgi:hypothetical protein